jgi:hypothetical protein
MANISCSCIPRRGNDRVMVRKRSTRIIAMYNPDIQQQPYFRKESQRVQYQCHSAESDMNFFFVFEMLGLVTRAWIVIENTTRDMPTSP